MFINILLLLIYKYLAIQPSYAQIFDINPMKMFCYCSYTNALSMMQSFLSMVTAKLLYLLIYGFTFAVVPNIL